MNKAIILLLGLMVLYGCQSAPEPVEPAAPTERSTEPPETAPEEVPETNPADDPNYDYLDDALEDLEALEN